MDTAASGNHRFAEHHLAALRSGGGDELTLSMLANTERSWRLATIRVLFDRLRELDSATGPLPPVDDAWRLLVQASAKAPAEVEQILAAPTTGTWAAYLLRRLRGTTRSDVPLWVDVGYLHALAAAAASRACLEFEIDIPTREGAAMLPTIGCAIVPTRTAWGRVRASQVDGTTLLREIEGKAEVRVSAGDGPDWWTLRRVQCASAKPVLRLVLDDLDTFRDLRAPSRPNRLPASEVEHWRSLLDRAWQLLSEVHPLQAQAMARGLSSIVPVPAVERFRPLSASSGEAFGSAVLSHVNDVVTLAVTLVHEFQHIKLGALLHLITMYRDDEPAARFYAPWRDDPRPLGGMLQGAYAFFGITEFWRRLRKGSSSQSTVLADFEFALWRLQTRSVLGHLLAQPELTAQGKALIGGLLETVGRWDDEVVDPETIALASRAARDHRALWRAHHVIPDTNSVATIVEAWNCARCAPSVEGEGHVSANPLAQGLDARAVLMRLRIVDTQQFERLKASRSAEVAGVRGASRADLYLVSGDAKTALALYLAELEADPQRTSAWVGLGLARELLGDSSSPSILVRCPELVRAVHRTLLEAERVPISPLQLVAWLESPERSGCSTLP